MYEIRKKYMCIEASQRRVINRFTSSSRLKVRDGSLRMISELKYCQSTFIYPRIFTKITLKENTRRYLALDIQKLNINKIFKSLPWICHRVFIFVSYNIWEKYIFLTTVDSELKKFILSLVWNVIIRYIFFLTIIWILLQRSFYTLTEDHNL